MEDQVLAKLIEFVEMASPALWAAAKRQVLVQVAQESMFFVLAVAFAVFLFRLARKSLASGRDPASDYTDDEMCVFYGIALGFFGGCVAAVALSLLTAVVGQLINPDYYAIRVLLQLFQQ